MKAAEGRYTAPEGYGKTERIKIMEDHFNNDYSLDNYWSNRERWTGWRRICFPVAAIVIGVDRYGGAVEAVVAAGVGLAVEAEALAVLEAEVLEVVEQVVVGKYDYKNTGDINKALSDY